MYFENCMFQLHKSWLLEDTICVKNKQILWQVLSTYSQYMPPDTSYDKNDHCFNNSKPKVL